MNFCLPPSLNWLQVIDHQKRGGAFHNDGRDLIYAAGLQWHVSDRWGLQVFYEHVNLDIESSKLGATSAKRG